MDLKKCEFSENMLSITYNWLQDHELKELTNTPDFTKEDQVKWFKKIKNDPTYKIWSVCFDEEIIGVFGIKNISNIDGEYWGYIGNKNFWGLGIGKWMIDQTINYSKEIGLSKLFLHVLESNTKAYNLYVKKGFYPVNIENALIEMEIIL